jgi:HD-GYP domain-containing protein (c-di-GMP phosphodiesterase class II)
MLKHIVLIGDNASLRKAVESRIEPGEAEVVLWEAGTPLPPLAGAIVARSADAEAAAEAALQLCAREEQFLNLLADAIDSREDFPAGSSQRVRDHATRFAKAIGLSAADQLTLERGALVRGIGKLHVPTKVLLKDSVLTYDEWDLLQKHTTIGADLVSTIDALQDTADVVRRYHCCYDGTGYPDGLEGDEIPLLGRAMRILDVYCAMTSPRHYREGHASHEEALAHLNDESGKHFDPELVKMFVDAGIGQPMAD